MSTIKNAPSSRLTNALDVFRTVYVEPEEDTQFDVTIFFNSIRDELRKLIEEAIEKRKAIKWHLLIKVNQEKTSADREEEIITRYFHSDAVPEFTIDNLEEHLEETHS